MAYQVTPADLLEEYDTEAAYTDDEEDNRKTLTNNLGLWAWTCWRKWMAILPQLVTTPIIKLKI